MDAVRFLEVAEVIGCNRFVARLRNIQKEPKNHGTLKTLHAWK